MLENLQESTKAAIDDCVDGSTAGRKVSVAAKGGLGIVGGLIMTAIYSVA
jgi:hypothetical protein